MSAEAEGGSCSSRPQTRTDSSLGTSPPSLPGAGACGTAGCQPEGVPGLEQVQQPATCSLPAFYNGIKYGMHTPRHTRSHGNQATGSTLPSPTQSTPAPGRLPDPREVRQGPVCTTGQSKWEMGQPQQYFKPQRSISVAECEQNLPNTQNKCLRKSIFPAGCTN